MNGRSDQVQAMYQEYVGITKAPTAAALLVLAEQLADIDHQLCLGIRAGLFGSDAPSSSSILDQSGPRETD